MPAPKLNVKKNGDAMKDVPEVVEETVVAAGAQDSVVEVVEEQPVVKQKVTKGKKLQPAVDTTVADAVVSEEVDMIEKVAHEVENLEESKAIKLVPTLLNNIDADNFRLGGVLAVIQAHGWFMNQDCQTFREYVETKCGLAYRKAMYLIQIYNGLVQSGVKWAQVKHLGWTKLKELSSILTPENVDEWVAVAESMTVLQLQEYIKQATAAQTNKADAPVDAQPSAVTTKTFKLHDDQKATVLEALEKCKSEMDTDSDAVALEHICLDYLAGESPLKKLPTLSELMKGKSMEEVLEAFSEVFPEADLTVEVPE